MRRLPLPRRRQLLPIALAAAACCAGAVASGRGTQPAGASGTAVGTSWARPAMTNPITVTLHVGADSLNLQDDRDYILKMPSQKKTGPLVIHGGRNVEILGGYMSTKTEGPNIKVWDDAGTKSGRIVHIEGVLIDGSSGVPSDGIRIEAPKTIVQLERDRIVGLIGSLNGYHADVIQPSGGVQELRIDGLTGASHYNDLYFRRETNPLEPAVGKAIIRNANLFGYVNGKGSTPATTIRALAIGTQSNPPSDDSQAINCKVAGQIVLQNVWMTPPGGMRPSGFVWPDDRMSGSASACDAAYKASTASVSWPKLSTTNGGQVSGALTAGAHTDFVPSGTAGLNYHG